MDRIDFRSDTVTWPTPAMREAMANALVGDDVYGEDPTVNRLQSMAAEKAGKEAALFVASGTMGNLVSILSHANRGDEAIIGVDGHALRSEAGSMATVGGIIPRPLQTNEKGRMDLSEVEAAVRPDNPHYPTSRLILVENSFGSRYGYPIEPNYFAKVSEIAGRHGLAVHMDGARLFNAAAALRINPCELTRHVDSVSFCLSKGLCAPVGSLVCGSAEFVHRAHRMRKSLGGGMRQAGVLAAAGVVALEEMVDRLPEDHKHAQMLARGLAEIEGIVVDPEMVKTNIVFFQLEENVSLAAPEVAKRLREKANVWVGGWNPNHFRAVTHYWVGPAEVETLLGALEEVLQEA